MKYDNFITFYGEDSYLVGRKIKDTIKEISEKEKINEFNIFSYDFEDDDFYKFLEDATTISLFSPKKIIVFQNQSFLKDIKKDDINILENFIKNNNNVFFITRADKKPTKNTPGLLSNIIFLYSKILEVEKPDIRNYKNIILNMLVEKKFKTSIDVIDYLFQKLNGDFARIDSEIEKLILYKENEKEITKEDIDLSVRELVDDNIFKLIQDLLSKNKRSIVKTYTNMKELNIKNTQIISLLFYRLSLMAMAKHLKEKGKSQDAIARMLNVSPGRVYYLLRDAGIENSKTFYEKINDLSLLDYQIKSGEISDDVGLELYLLSG